MKINLSKALSLGFRSKILNHLLSVSSKPETLSRKQSRAWVKGFLHAARMIKGV